MKLPKIKLTFIGALGFGIAAISLSANAAEDLSYSYLELDYINLNIDEVGDSGNFLDDIDNGSGYGAKGSISLSSSWFAFAEYSETEADVSFVDDLNQFYSSDTEINRLDLGLGFHTSLGANTDLGDFDNTSFIGNLMYEFSPGFGLNFGIEAGSDISHYLVGLRFSF